MIIQTNTLESIRPLTADERLASWAWRYLSAGYHHNPEGTYAQTRSHDSWPMPLDCTVRDCGRTAARGAVMNKPTIPEVLERFREYHKQWAAWGSLHVVLDDGNTEDGAVKCCIDYAKERADEEGLALAEILLRMSPTQRGKLGRIA